MCGTFLLAAIKGGLELPAALPVSGLFSIFLELFFYEDQKAAELKANLNNISYAWC